jgi:serine/threonine protein kinase
MQNGDLQHFIDTKKDEKPFCWTENDALRLNAQLIAGLSYLHEEQIIHRDLKPSNVFLGSKDELVIGDFGISDSLETTRRTKIIGTDFYLPPEAIEEGDAERLSFTRDIWGCGVIIYMLSYLRHPFIVSSRMRTLMNICDGFVAFDVIFLYKF